MKVSLLDYGAGNVRSVRNAISALGYEVQDISCASDILQAQIIVFPGVGSFGSAMRILKEKGYVEALQNYLKDLKRPFLGICLGMQTLFQGSDECNEKSSGLGLIKGRVVKFNEKLGAVPHMGWNGRVKHMDSPVLRYVKEEEEVYFVHSYYAPLLAENEEWVMTSTTYAEQRFISAIQKGAVVATQFHPEKSAETGLNILKGFLEAAQGNNLFSRALSLPRPLPNTTLVKRVVVALDVRSNDHGDLVVTKGDQYDVRENKPTSQHKGTVRNLGKPVMLANRYYREGADEIAFLNITSFRQGVIDDHPMLHLLEEASKNCFVPLTVGGGIRTYFDQNTGTTYSALQVASRYFRAGADKISIGSDAVYAAQNFIKSQQKTGTTSIEQISKLYGNQAVVISIDPKRVYLTDNHTNPPNTTLVQLPPSQRGPNNEQYCWYQCTVKGGRQPTDICAVSLAKACQALGAGEIMLNCIDMDGQCQGFDHALMKAVCNAVSIPVIASSGAGKEQHFTDVFLDTPVQAALAAGIFHRNEVHIQHVKKHMIQHGIPARLHCL